MLDFVDVGERELEAYRGIVSDELMDAVAQAPRGISRRAHAARERYALRRGRIGAAALRVPLLNDLGLVADWRIISGNESFFEIDQGHPQRSARVGAVASTDGEKRCTWRTAETNADTFEEDYDFVVVHDPQPAALLPPRQGSFAWIWRCHIDTSDANPHWSFLREFLADYDAAIFTLAEFVPRDFPIRTVGIIPPAIDPLSPKNLDLPRCTALARFWSGSAYGSPPPGTQVSRFDPWKVPLGVIAAYRLARGKSPDLQLALVGSMALDDPEGWDIYRQIRAARRRTPWIHVFTNLVGVGTSRSTPSSRSPTSWSRSRCAKASGWSSRRRSGRERPWWPVVRAAFLFRWGEGTGGISWTASRSARAIVELLRIRRVLGAGGERARTREAALPDPRGSSSTSSR